MIAIINISNNAPIDDTKNSPTPGINSFNKELGSSLSGFVIADLIMLNQPATKAPVIKTNIIIASSRLINLPPLAETSKYILETRE